MTIRHREIVIRIAKEGDIKDILHIRRTTWLATYVNQELGITKQVLSSMVDTLESQERTRMRLGKNTRHSNTWIAKEGEKIVAFCRASRTRDGEGIIKQLYVIPSHQKKGIGGRLLQRCLRWLAQSKQIRLCVAAYNKEAIEFYRKYNFRKSRKKNEGFRFPDGTVLPQTEMILVAK